MSVDYITAFAAKKLAGHQFSRLRHGFMAVGTYQGRAFRVGYAEPKGYYVEWDIADDVENPKKFLPRKHGTFRITDIDDSAPYHVTRMKDESEDAFERRIDAIRRKLKETHYHKDVIVNPKFHPGGTVSEGEFIRIWKSLNNDLLAAVKMKRKSEKESILRQMVDLGNAHMGLDKAPLDNPKRVKIYQKTIKIYASKAGMAHQCDAACKKAGHRYVHTFKNSSASCIYGLPDGSIWIGD